MRAGTMATSDGVCACRENGDVRRCLVVNYTSDVYYQLQTYANKLISETWW